LERLLVDLAESRGGNMSKKIMLIALAVISAALFALPAAASAQEVHFEPGNGIKFNINGLGGEFRAEGEPTITCEAIGGSGSFDAGSSTTGSLTLDFTGCHTTVFGFTAACKSEGSAVSNTIAASGTFHLITVGGLAGTLITFIERKLICAGISTMTVTGNVIGTITSPKCGESSKSMGTSFTATGTTQNHLTYTGVNYDLQSRTGTEAEKTAAWAGTDTTTSENAQKLNCT